MSNPLTATKYFIGADSVGTNHYAETAKSTVARCDVDITLRGLNDILDCPGDLECMVCLELFEFDLERESY